MPRIHRNGAQLNRVQQRQQVSADVARLFLAVLRLDGLNAYAGRSRVRRFLLIETLAVDSVGESLQDQRAVLHCRKNEVGDARVEAHHVALGKLLLGKEDLVEVRDFESFAPTEI